MTPYEQTRADLSAPAPVDETKAPDPLPEVLPAGTEFANSRYRWRLLSDATRRHDHWLISAAFERIEPDHELLSHATGAGSNVYETEVSWPSYHAALRSPPATVPACDACGEESNGVEYGVGAGTLSEEAFPDESIHLCQRHAFGVPGPETVKDIEARRKSLAKDAPECSGCLDAAVAARVEAGRRGVGFTVICQSCQKRHAREPEAGDPEDETTERCPDCHDGSACLPGGCGADGCERCGKTCPTCMGSVEVKAGFTKWRDEQNRIAATKLDQAKQSLDRPGHAKRFGKMLDRDCYGQLFSAKGWETEEP